MVRTGDRSFIKKRRLGGAAGDCERDVLCEDEREPVDNITKRYGIGAKLLSKMGYKQGQGLGRDGSGISVPVEPEKRSVANAGLGSLAAAVNEEPESDSSSDEETLTKASNLVAFQRTAMEALPNLVPDNDSELRDLVRNLRLNCKLDISDDIQGLDVASKDGLELLARELLDVQASMEALESRLTLLEPELLELDDEMKILQELKSHQGESSLDSFKLKSELILSLDDNDLIDQLFAEMLQKVLSPFSMQWLLSEEVSKVLPELLWLISMLKYRMDDASMQLNRTQTVIFQVVIEKLKPCWQNFTLNKVQVNVIITLILDFKPILKFTNCEDYILKKYIYPKLIEGLEVWEICDDSGLPPRMWYFDFSVIIDQETRSKLEEIIEVKFTKYCDSWHHRRSVVLRKANLIFIQEVLGKKKYLQIVKEFFLPNFIDQLWDKYFDPVIELEDNSVEDGSFYYFEKLREYRPVFDPNDYKIMVSAIFNELNKILYQWLLYADDEDLAGAKWWFNWFMNSMFATKHPTDVESDQVRRTLSFFDDPSALKHPLHEETFNLRVSLNLSEHCDEYNMQNIPLRKVQPTFKNVVEDFCEHNGYILEKTSSYTQLRHGTNQDSLVPVFKIYRNGSNFNVAIKDDILWVEKDRKEFVPMYLYELAS